MREGLALESYSVEAGCFAAEETRGGARKGSERNSRGVVEKENEREMGR